MKKVIVLGLDGLEPKITESMLKNGELPNLAMIEELGGYTRIQTTYPAQTPVAWSTFATGTNPGGHGIFDFLGRNPKTYLPVLALSRYEQKNIFTLPKVVNLRRGVALWELLSDAGLPSTVIRCPCTYPPDQIQGRMLAGVGVPDLRGGLGTSTFYTSADGVKQENSEKVLHVIFNNDGQVNTHLIGPINPKDRTDFILNISIIPHGREKKITIRSKDLPNDLEVRLGQWSDWLKVIFKTGMLQTAKGIVRFYLKQIEPTFELYASQINFDPEAPLFPISSPPEYAGELETRLGTYYTTGMAEDHDGLINGRIDEAAFLDQCQIVLRERKKMMLLELNRLEEGFFFCLFDTPDRLQHMLWRFRESEHPANRHGFSSAYSQAIEEHYRECDEIVGEALNFVDEDTLFIVLSDHGMNSFQRGLNLNTWLYENGFLTLKKGYKPGEETGEFFHNVDWDHTSAYSLGLGAIFLNLKGREERGIVSRNEAEAVKNAIIQGLTGLADPKWGKTAVRNVVASEQVFSGPYVDEAPDLLVNFSEGYRVSWDTPLGGVPEGIFEDNTKRWGGDHVIDPVLVPGVLFMNKPFRRETAKLVDMAPTILSALGVPKGKAMEGENLLF